MKCGLDPYQLSYMSLSEVNAVVEGRRDEFTQKDRGEWVKARYISWIISINNPNVKRVDKPRLPEDLFLLKGEKYPIKRISAKKQKERVELMRKRWNI